MPLKRSVTAQVATLVSRRTPVLATSPRGPIALFAPTSHGSLGDEALVLGSGSLLDELGRDWSLYSPGSPDPWLALGVREAHDWRDGLRRGGLRWTASPNDAPNPSAVVVIGADSIDTSYGIRGVSAKISALNGAARAGAPATLFNFSMQESVPSDGIRLLRTLDRDVRVIARDTLSQARASRLLGRSDVGVAPDVAVFLEPEPTESSEQAKSIAADRRVAAMTVNNHLRTKFSTVNTLKYFNDLGAALLDLGYDVFVVAHDIREDPGDPTLANAVARSLGDRSRVFVPRNARQAKAILSHARLHVSARMHAAVASLTMGVPTIGLDYVDKFRGQFDWYNAAEFVVPWTSANLLNEVRALTSRIESSYDDQSKMLRERVSPLRDARETWPEF